jgi:hypothetical protein
LALSKSLAICPVFSVKDHSRLNTLWSLGVLQVVESTQIFGTTGAVVVALGVIGHRFLVRIQAED